MGQSHFSLDPAAPLCLPRTKTQSNAMMSSQPLSWEQNLCVAQQQQKNLCVALTPNVLGSATVLLHKPLIQDSRIYFPPAAVIQASGKSWFFSWHADVTNISLTCVGCGVTAEFINSQNAYSPKKGKFEFHICGILTCTDVWFFSVSLIGVSWEETKSVLEQLFIRLHLRLNVALFWDLGLVRHSLRNSEFLFVKLFEWACNNA